MNIFLRLKILNGYKPLLYKGKWCLDMHENKEIRKYYNKKARKKEGNLNNQKRQEIFYAWCKTNGFYYLFEAFKYDTIKIKKSGLRFSFMLLPLELSYISELKFAEICSTNHDANVKLMEKQWKEFAIENNYSQYDYSYSYLI